MKTKNYVWLYATPISVLIAVLIILYPLSIAPVMRLCGRSQLKYSSALKPPYLIMKSSGYTFEWGESKEPELLDRFYEPLMWMCSYSPHFRDTLDIYLQLWGFKVDERKIIKLPPIRPQLNF